MDKINILENTKQQRIKRLFDTGLTFDGENFLYRDINFHQTELSTMDDEEFEQFIIQATDRIKSYKNHE